MSTVLPNLQTNLQTAKDQHYGRRLPIITVFLLR
jgi:hypothetical protein